MKKIGTIIIVLLLSTGIFVLGFNDSKDYEPNDYYEVYLNAKKIGTISSEKELNNYINKKGEEIKNKYQVDKVYAPSGLEIVKVATYSEKVDNVEDIYNIIAQNSSFTIDGYQFTIKYNSLDTGETQTKKVYVTNKDFFTTAVSNVIKSYVGTDAYQAYLNGTQVSVSTTGSYINNVYLGDDITVKADHISVDNTIYISSDDVAQYLLYGTNPSNVEYTVKDGETVSEIAYSNKVSVNDFLLSNPKLTSENALLYVGQKVNIGVPDPQIHVVKEEYVVRDQEEKYTLDEIYDATMISGARITMQDGQDGIIRVSENVKTVNGLVNYVDTVSKVEIKAVINQVVKIGTRYVPSIGTGNWVWPTESGWTISSTYSYRINPISGKAELHDGIDIAGTGYGSNIYAADNGVVTEVSYTYMNGYYVVINHQNGYYTYYGHMIRRSDLTVGQTVERGQVIGHIGSTGWATGPHLHFGAFVGAPYHGGYSFNPLRLY